MSIRVVPLSDGSSSSKKKKKGGSGTARAAALKRMFADSFGTFRGRSRQEGADDGVSRKVSTAVVEQYEMWLMPLHEFVGLSVLEPHQKLRRQDKVVRWNSNMKHVFFISHQWTSFDHPDHTGEQLRTMQLLILKFMRGQVADTAPDYTSRIYLPNDVKITTKEWQHIVTEGNAFVWPVWGILNMLFTCLTHVTRACRIDFASIPQVGKYYHADADDVENAQSDLIKAVNSIPAYIERCTHFFAVCPTIHHKDLPGTVCDYGSWLGRSWCNLELWALQLARFGELPAIVVKGGGIAPYMMAAGTAVARVPGHGELTCCARGHVLCGADGTKRTIPCDRVKIGGVLVTMLEKRQKHHLGRVGELDEYREWCSVAQMVLSGLPEHRFVAAKAPRNAKDFLRAYKFEDGAGGGGNGEARRSSSGRLGLTPVHLAAGSGNATVLRELLELHGGANARTRSADLTFGLDKGVTPLHIAMAFARCEERKLEATIVALLEAGADPNAPSASGVTPLARCSCFFRLVPLTSSHACTLRLITPYNTQMTAVGYMHLDGVRALIKFAGALLDLEREFRVNNSTALSWAAYGSTTEIVKVLLEAGADRTHVTDHGGTKLTDACANPNADVRMLELLWKGTEVKVSSSAATKLNLNCVRRPRTRMWGAIDRLFEFGMRIGVLSKTAFNLDMTHKRSCTPLHVAAKHGHFAQVRWLLSHGAHKSLRMHDAMGATPLEVAAIFGPHLEVEAVLGGVMLKAGFESRFQLRSGSLVTKSLDAAGGSALKSSALRQANDTSEAQASTAPVLGRSISTAVQKEFEMWLIPLHEFIGLSALEPHQALRRQGKMVRWDPQMKNIFFLSHQWTSFDHPDHTGKQLRTMQSLFLKFMRGQVADTSPESRSRVYLPDDVKITTKEWKHVVTEGNAFVWPVRTFFPTIFACRTDAHLANRIDFASIPQVGKYYHADADDVENAQSDLIKAVNSIPAYIERCTHFFAVCPTIHHKDLPGTVCDYGSWLGRSWCNLELWALQLARFGELPAIVVKGGGIAPYMMAPQSAAARVPGYGELTCCARGHVLCGADGTKRTIPCDRVKIGGVLVTMLEKRQKHHLGRVGELDEYREWCAGAQTVLSGLPARDAVVAEAPRNAKDFLRAYKFGDGTGGGEDGEMHWSLGRLGLTPVHLAAGSGNVTVLCELLELHGGANARTRSTERMFGTDKGMTPLHIAVCGARCAEPELETIVVALLEAGADPNAVSASGMTPLMSAIAWHHASAVRALVKCAGARLDLERGFRANNSTALGWAAYGSTTEIVEVLLEAGADRAHINDHGAGKLTSACSNPDADVRMLELLWKGVEGAAAATLDLNCVMSPRTCKWGALDRFFEFGVRSGALPKTAFNLGLAHTRGSTPLHLAAKHGHIALVCWLLARGAQASLHTRNAMGATPLEVAAIFGPHPEVEAMLGAAMLGHTAA